MYSVLHRITQKAQHDTIKTFFDITPVKFRGYFNSFCHRFDKRLYDQKTAK